MQPRASDDTHAPGAKARLAWTTRPGSRALRVRHPHSSLVLGVLIHAAVVSTRWVRLNLSPSVPRGVYRLTAVREPLARGTLVVLPVPASVQAWHPWWIPLLKPVAGIPGDVVCHHEQTLFVNGVSFGLVYQVANAQPLPYLAEGCAVVPDSTVFLASPAPRSLDSRYFAPVDVRDITALASPLWTWR